MISFDFCQAADNSSDSDPVENLGQVVFGERLRASPYEVLMILLGNVFNKLFHYRLHIYKM